MSARGVRDDFASQLIVNQGRAISEPVLFVVGTDTGVGKTTISAVLAGAAASRGVAAGYLKPCQTGVIPRDGGGDFLGDPRLVSTCTPYPDETLVESVAHELGTHVQCRTTYRLAMPAAPPYAAIFEGIEIDTAKIVSDLEKLKESCDFVVVEAAGGLLAPLTDSMTMGDFASELGLPTLIVTRAELGTLNHTALTVEAATRRGLDVVGLAVARVPSHPTAVESHNLETLPKLTRLDLVLAVPEWMGNPEQALHNLARERAGVAASGAASEIPVPDNAGDRGLPARGFVRHLAMVAKELPGGFSSPRYH